MKTTLSREKINTGMPLLLVNPFLEGINKVKDLIQELEESFRESSNVGNNLILRCVLLRAENQNLIHKIDEKNLSTTLYNRQWQLSVLSQEKSKSVVSNTKRITCTDQSNTTRLPQPLVLRNADEVDILHKTIGDLQKKLRERDKKIEMLCQKYLYLKTNKKKMESELRSKILSLEKQLDMTYSTISEFQNEVEAIAGRCLTRTKNTYEALFLQEKLRCSKLMYEKVRLHHEIKTLEDIIRRERMNVKDESDCWNVIRGPLGKCSSEPYMKHF